MAIISDLNTIGYIAKLVSWPVDQSSDAQSTLSQITKLISWSPNQPSDAHSTLGFEWEEKIFSLIGLNDNIKEMLLFM